MLQNIPLSWADRELVPPEMGTILKQIADSRRVITSIRLYTGDYTSTVYNAIEMIYGRDTKSLDEFRFRWESWTIIIQSIVNGKATWYKVKYQ